MANPIKPLILNDNSFLTETMQKPQKIPVAVCERNVSLLTDPDDLLYESMSRQLPEQIIRAEAFHKIGDRQTMPYPKREVN